MSFAIIIKNSIKRFFGMGNEYYLEKLKKRGLKVGKNFIMHDQCMIDECHCWHIEIGDDVVLAPRVHILAHDASTKLYLNHTKVKNTVIGNRVFIGAESVLLPGVHIGDNAIVGAGSVVTKSIPANSVAAGNPARVIAATDKYMDKNKRMMSATNCFDERYTLGHNISDAMKREMKERIDKEGIAFVI